MKKLKFIAHTESSQENIRQYLGSIVVEGLSNIDGFATEVPLLGGTFIYFHETSEIAYEDI